MKSLCTKLLFKTLLMRLRKGKIGNLVLLFQETELKGSAYECRPHFLPFNLENKWKIMYSFSIFHSFGFSVLYSFFQSLLR